MRDAVNGQSVTRAELRAHLERWDDRWEAIDSRLARIEVRLDARPVQRWVTGRFTGLIDKALPLAIAVVVGYVATHVF